jgi:hypothetical protein
MEEWAHRKNIERFERDLVSEADPQKRRRLQEYLEAERGRLAEIQRRREFES